MASVVWPFPRPLEVFYALPSINRLVCITISLYWEERNSFFFCTFDLSHFTILFVILFLAFRSWLLAIVNHYYCSKIFCHHICDHGPLSVSLLNVNSYLYVLKYKLRISLFVFPTRNQQRALLVISAFVTPSPIFKRCFHKTAFSNVPNCGKFRYRCNATAIMSQLKRDFSWRK